MDDNPAHVAVESNTPHVLILTLEEYHEYFKFVIEHALFTYAGVLYIQHCGIPMGVEPGVLIANNTMWAYEYDFIERLIKNKEFNLLMRCKWVRRYIDDLIALSMPVFVKLRYIEDKFKSPETNRWVKGIYPRGTKADPILELKQEASLVTKRGHPVQIAFLDLAIDWDKEANLLCYKTYDKRVDIKYDRTRLARFPSPYTMLWPTCMEGVFTSELHRFLSTCSSRQAFIITAAKCLYELYRNGFDWSLLISKLSSFLEFRVPPPPGVAWLIQMRQRKHDTSSLAGACLNMIERTALFFVQYGQPEIDHRNRWLSFTPWYYQQAPPPGHDYRDQYSLP